MEKSTKKKKSNIVLIIGILLIVVILVVIFVMKNMNKEDSDSGENITIAEGNYSDEIKTMSIETPYCDLFYPQKWESNLKIETVTKKENYTVQFWAKFKNKNAIQLFDITFAGKKGNIGSIIGKDGKKVYVSIDSYDFELDDKWTDEEEMEINSMLKDINYLLLQLEKVEGFEPSQK